MGGPAGEGGKGEKERAKKKGARRSPRQSQERNAKDADLRKMKQSPVLLTNLVSL